MQGRKRSTGILIIFFCFALRDFLDHFFLFLNARFSRRNAMVEAPVPLCTAEVFTICASVFRSCVSLLYRQRMMFSLVHIAQDSLSWNLESRRWHRWSSRMWHRSHSRHLQHNWSLHALGRPYSQILRLFALENSIEDCKVLLLTGPFINATLKVFSK